MRLLIRKGVGIPDPLGKFRVGGLILRLDVPLQSVARISVLEACCNVLAPEPRHLFCDDRAPDVPRVFHEELDLHGERVGSSDNANSCVRKGGEPTLRIMIAGGGGMATVCSFNELRNDSNTLFTERFLC